MPIPQASDTINLTYPTAGDANAGNGGDGTNHGNISYDPSAYLDSFQKVEGAHTDLHNGDHVWQKADWEAGGGGDGGFSKAYGGFLADVTNNGPGGAGGDATSNGSQTSESGGNTATVNAATTATQLNMLEANQSGMILAGVGGSGGNGNTANGGDVSAALVHMASATDTTTDTTTVTNTLDHFVNAFGHVDLSDIGS